VQNWYRRHARELPWRVGPAATARGERQDPYLVWLSEIMLQQTTVPHAAPYFLKFRERWPGVAALAAADWEDVSAAWAGLGYYSRARNLHACAKAVAARGGFPQARAGLLELPGVGPYTAAAVAAIAFGEKVAPVDGNIERVVSRLYAIGGDGTEAGWRTAKKDIVARAQALFDALPESFPAGDLAQALMDLGATVCTPRKPACAICPLFDPCTARRAGEAEAYPVKPAKKAQPVRQGAAFIVVRGDEVLLTRRPPEGLLGGMVMPLSSDWTETARPDPLAGAPEGFAWERVGEVRHVFTHFALKLDVWRAQAKRGAKTPAGAMWMTREAALEALPTVGAKAVRLALGD
jgi:A/G-specific adenine glycosylase